MTADPQKDPSKAAKPSSKSFAQLWRQVSTSVLPFADAASDAFPLDRILRLALIQVTVGMAIVLLTGVLNRVMIVELGVAASLVAIVVALPVLFAPLRVLVGHRSDQHRSFLGWRRVPYIWLGTMLQFGGLAIMPFALLVLSDLTSGPSWAGPTGAAVAFLLVGAGLHTTQTCALALATDLSPDADRPRVVALMYLCLLLGSVVAALVFAWLLQPFSSLRLIQVIQGAAVVTVALNVIAFWKQESRNPHLTRHGRPRESLKGAWRVFTGQNPHAVRLLVVVGLGSAGFAMQDVLLEPYGGEILGLAVGQTTLLTGVLALGTVLALALSASFLQRGRNEYRLAATGLLVGIVGFSLIIFAAPMNSLWTFSSGVFVVGMGVGLFAISTMFAVMHAATEKTSGLALGLWGAVQASAIGAGVAIGGVVRDMFRWFEFAGGGSELSNAAFAYSFVYHLEILVLFSTLIAVGPLVRMSAKTRGRFGLMDMPG